MRKTLIPNTKEQALRTQIERNGKEFELAGGNPIGSKRLRIGARTRGELTGSSSDREIRGSEATRRRRARLPRKAPGVEAARGFPRARVSRAPRLVSSGALARCRLGLCVCCLPLALGVLMVCLFAKPPSPRLRSYRGRRVTESLFCGGGREAVFIAPFTG